MSRSLPAREPAIQVDRLRVDIGGSSILQGVGFQVAAGGVTALIGRNGVGKTTTLRAILGLLPATGEVKVLGRVVSGWPAHRIVRLGVGYVPEDRDVFAGLTVRENLRLAETGPDPQYAKVYELFPELEDRGRQGAGTLSGGQQQMLSIGRILLHDRPVLLVDEPTKGLSPLVVTEVVAALEKISTRATVLLVEQNIHVVRRLARDVVVLDHGEVVHVGGTDELGDEGFLRRLLGVSGAA